MRKLILTLGIMVLIIGAALAGIGNAYKNFLKTPLIVSEQPVTYILAPGTSVRMLATDLQKRGMQVKPVFLIALAYSKHVQKNLKAGEYLFNPGMTPEQVLSQIVAGKVVHHRFTIVEGWTFNQLLAALNKEPLLTHTLTNQTPIAIAAQLKIAANSPEGWFFPATYNFTMGATDVSVLEKAHRLMKHKLNLAWQQKAANVPYQTPYDALIAASLVEKESARADERPIIAGILIKRMQENMPLQIDSTVIYGLGASYTGKIHSVDLHQDTPYNTYTRKGLPPTPIAMPSEASLTATLHPIISDALYFVAKTDGTHQFSNTLNEHNQAVATYQIGITPPQIGRKIEKLKCPEPWYLPETLYPLFSIDCQFQS